MKPSPLTRPANALPVKSGACAQHAFVMAWVLGAASICLAQNPSAAPPAFKPPPPSRFAPANTQEAQPRQPAQQPAPRIVQPNAGQPIPVQSRPGPARSAQPQATQSRPGQPQQHLPQWIDSHRNLAPEQQQRALQQEPGFHQLPPETQQRMQNRLTQLNNMPPEKRQRVLERTEAMERLSQAQRQQVRSAAQQLGALPLERRRAVSRAFHDLRDLPEAQRQYLLNSPQMHGQFSDVERNTLTNLIDAAPYMPLAAQPAPPQ